MQTPVRFYITQDDDKPIVRTIPVATHPVPRLSTAAERALPMPKGSRAPRKVAKLVRFATRRTGPSQ